MKNNNTAFTKDYIHSQIPWQETHPAI